MAEYDAFGRKKGDNPLEQLGSTAGPAARTPVPASPVPPPSRWPKGFLIAIAIAALVVMASIGAAVSLLAGSSVEGGLEAVPVEESQRAPVATPAATGSESEPEPGGSLLTRPVLARAIRAMRSAELGRPLNLRVAADRLDARLVSPRGRLRIVQVGPSGEPRKIAETAGAGAPAMQWSDVDPAAPGRLIRTAAKREKRSAADVDYLVLMNLGKPTWGLFFKGGTHYQGDTAGRVTRRVTP